MLTKQIKSNSYISLVQMSYIGDFEKLMNHGTSFGLVVLVYSSPTAITFSLPLSSPPSLMTLYLPNPKEMCNEISGTDCWLLWIFLRLFVMSRFWFSVFT